MKYFFMGFHKAGLLLEGRMRFRLKNYQGEVAFLFYFRKFFPPRTGISYFNLQDKKGLK